MLASPAALIPMIAQRGLSERVAEQLAEKIVSKVPLPSVRLQSETEPARQLGGSRTVMREAVSRLKSDGLLEPRQGIGAFVRNEAMRPLRLDPLTSAGEVLQALVDIDAAVAQGGDGVDEDINFHRTIAEASGDPYILSVLTFVGQYLRSGTRVTRANGARRANFARQVRGEHRAAVAAIEAAHAAASRHMQQMLPKVKMINQLLAGVHVAAAAEAIALGKGWC
jgi:GntR family transcriptional repressor for pyruvate dehydrogenase complex